MDTEESQRLLKYQKYSFDDLVKETKKRLGIARVFTVLLRPTIRWMLLKKSPYYQAFLKSIRDYYGRKWVSPKLKRKTIKKTDASKEKTVKSKPHKTGS
jgi:hypothetical protein